MKLMDSRPVNAVENAHLQMDFVDRIYLRDWPLVLLNEWIEKLVDENDPSFIRAEVCQAIDGNYTINQRISRKRFCEILFANTSCGGKLCRNNCGGKCATSGNIRQIPELERFSNFKPLQSEILKHYFFKLSDLTSGCLKRSRIGILVLYLSDNKSENEFIKREKCLIINQLSNKFYITDYVLVDAEKIFNHVKHFIDAVVIIVDSHYAVNPCLNEYYAMLRKFKFLTVFLVKTEDIANSTNDIRIERHFKTILPENKIILSNWLNQAEKFPKIIRKHLTIGSRLKIAVLSRFVRKK